MLAASNRSGGQNFGFPDVCNTPVGSATVPLPYPNFAAHAQATGFATTVKIENMNALTLSASIPQTTGDEGGTAHSAFMQKGQFTTGSSIVFIEKHGVSRQVREVLALHGVSGGNYQLERL